MKIIALDQASLVTGWCYFEDKQLKDYGKISLKQEDIGERLYSLREEIKKLIEKYQPDKVYMEDIQLQNNISNNVHTFKVLAEVFGVIYELLTEMNIPNEAVLAGTWKSVLGIKGRGRAEQKQNAAKFVQETYGIKAIQDICDAICIGTYSFSKKDLHDWSD